MRQPFRVLSPAVSNNPLVKALKPNRVGNEFNFRAKPAVADRH